MRKGKTERRRKKGMMEASEEERDTMGERKRKGEGQWEGCVKGKEEGR